MPILPYFRMEITRVGRWCHALVFAIGELEMSEGNSTRIQQIRRISDGNSNSTGMPSESPWEISQRISNNGSSSNSNNGSSNGELIPFNPHVGEGERTFVPVPLGIFHLHEQPMYQILIVFGETCEWPITWKKIHYSGDGIDLERKLHISRETCNWKQMPPYDLKRKLLYKDYSLHWILILWIATCEDSGLIGIRGGARGFIATYARDKCYVDEDLWCTALYISMQ